MKYLRSTNASGPRPAMIVVMGALLTLLIDAGTVACNTPQESAQAKSSPAPTPSTAPVDEPEPSSIPTNSSAPEPSPSADADQPSETESDPPLPPPLHFERIPPAPLQTGWAVLTEKADDKGRAWIEGSIVSGDRLTINTENVRRFTLDLTRLRLNWQKRIVLRMDGFNSQLTKKRWPKLTFMRTSSGAWDVVEE